MAPRLDAAVRSERFGVAVGLASQARRTIQRRTERSTRRMLHLLNLPAGSDVTRILNELGQLQRQVRDLAKQVDESKEVDGGGTDNGPARPARPRPARR